MSTGLSSAGRSWIGILVRRASSSMSDALIRSASRAAVIVSSKVFSVPVCLNASRFCRLR